METPEFRAALASIKKRDENLDRVFGWMRHIPPKLPAKYDAWDYDLNRWKGLGPLMYLFWRTLADEGFYGALDMMSFHYFDDKYVMSFKDIRRARGFAKRYFEAKTKLDKTLSK